MKLRLFVTTGLVVLLGGCVSSSVEPLADAPDVPVPPTSSDIPDFSGTSIAPVRGTTTTQPVAIRGGNATLRGRVLVGGVPVGGASVRLERLVGDRVASIDVSANAEGFYEAGALLGGRYRVRAFRPPDSTQTRAEVFFVAAGENRTLDLSLNRFSGGADVRASISPDPPLLGQQATLTVSVTSRGVDNVGVARSIGASGLPVTLITAGGRNVVSANPAVTDGAGRARFVLTCSSLDNQGLTVLLPDGSSSNLGLGACQLPPPVTEPPTTTTTAPEGQIPPGQATVGD